MDSWYLTAAEQDIVDAAHDNRKRCTCGERHADDSSGVSPDEVGRMKGYLTAHPGQAFVVDDEAGIMAVIIAEQPGSAEPPDVIAWSRNLSELLDAIGASSAAALS